MACDWGQVKLHVILGALEAWAQPLGVGGPDPQNLDRPHNFLHSFLVELEFVHCITFIKRLS